MDKNVEKDCEGFDLTTSPGSNQGPPILNKTETYNIPVVTEIYSCFDDDYCDSVKKEQDALKEATESVEFYIDELFS